MNDNTWTNEFGDRIMEVVVGNLLYYTYIATNKDKGETERFRALRSAKIWLNKFKKAKKWTGSH